MSFFTFMFEGHFLLGIEFYMQLFSFTILKITFNCFLAFFVPIGKSPKYLVSPFKVICLFSSWFYYFFFVLVLSIYGKFKFSFCPLSYVRFKIFVWCLSVTLWTLPPHFIPLLFMGHQLLICLLHHFLYFPFFLLSVLPTKYFLLHYLSVHYFTLQLCQITVKAIPEFL